MICDVDIESELEKLSSDSDQLDDTGRANLLKQTYFYWLTFKVCDDAKYSLDKYVSKYGKLLRRLHDVEFRFSVSNDDNRAMDGLSLRDKFAYEYSIDDYSCLTGECTFLEMLIALAYRCENDIMTQTRDYNRSAKWFWCMLDNCGLSYYVDDKFDLESVDEIIDRVLDRTYFPDGTGGLFQIHDFEVIDEVGAVTDLRKMELWYQLSFWLQENYYSFEDDSASENLIVG